MLRESFAYLRNRDRRRPVFFPPSFQHPKPRGHQGKRKVMIPTHPCPHLIVGKPRFALATLETFFDVMLRFRQTGPAVPSTFFCLK